MAEQKILKNLFEFTSQISDLIDVWLRSYAADPLYKPPTREEVIEKLEEWQNQKKF